MDFFPEMQISASGLNAERARLEVIARNIANVNTTRTENGGVFRRQLVELVSTEGAQSGDGTTLPNVTVAGVVDDPSPLKLEYNPSHPDADEKGFVSKPNVDVMLEMVDMLSATRAYEANVTVLQGSKDMIRQALDI
jgi:flagellar basal-body rod protein FlgC